jgi:hypothetical protein
MALTDNIWRKFAATTLICAGIGLARCNGADVHIDAPILEAAGINLTSKKAEEDVPERSGIVIPPSTETLPEPGTRTAAADPSQSWPQDPDQTKAQREKAEAEAREKYCREGNWDGGNISEFDKAIGVEERCPSKVGQAISQSLGGGEATQ